MADDTNFRSYRQNDPRSRGPAGPSPSGREGSDPLAELARLIGQTDPFSELGHGAPARASRPTSVAGNLAQPVARPQNSFGAPPAPPPFHPPPFESQMPIMEPRRSGFQPAYDPAIYGAPPASPQAYYDGADQMPQADESYDDEFIERRPRQGTKTVVILVGLALLGTGAAFGYRYIFGGHSSAPPPVIKADATPSKVPGTNSGASSKAIYDRVNDPARGEKLEPREEQPVNVPADPRSASRVAFPGLPESADASTAASPPLGSMPPGPGAAEPKRIATVPIRPGQPIGEPIAPAANTPPPRAAAPAQRIASAPPAAPMPATASAPPPAANAPLSLAPQGLNIQTPALPSAPPTVPAAAQSAALDAGAYAVQISSQRSEAEAQTTFRTLQAKFPNLLGGRQPLIRRADLGEKGVYFRTLIGPFASLEEASQFCTSLKSAGGQCVLQRN